MTEEDAKKLAIDVACLYPQGYMPENIEEFEPHLWVIRAIQEAYRVGFEEGTEDAEGYFK